MRTTFLFWNIMKRPLQERIARIVAAHEVDVVLLAESALAVDDVLSALNTLERGSFWYPPSLGTKIQLYTRLSQNNIVELANNPLGGVNIRELRIGGRVPVLLAAVHLPSKINWDRDDQTQASSDLARFIDTVERQQNNFNTVLVGDLNMSPFDPGVAGARALHGVMTKSIAERQTRDVQGNESRFFYNPMWGCLGDRTEGPAGTYYFSSSKPINHFWYIYDQVLLRPALMHSLHSLRILESDGEQSLVSQKGIPSQSTASDHLPILFTLDL